MGMVAQASIAGNARNSLYYKYCPDFLKFFFWVARHVQTSFPPGGRRFFARRATQKKNFKKAGQYLYDKWASWPIPEDGIKKYWKT